MLLTYSKIIFIGDHEARQTAVYPRRRVAELKLQQGKESINANRIEKPLVKSLFPLHSVKQRFRIYKLTSKEGILLAKPLKGPLIELKPKPSR